MEVTLSPTAGEMLPRYVGDRIRFTILADGPVREAFLRTNLGRGSFLQADIAREYREELARWKASAAPTVPGTMPRDMAWRDIPLRRSEDGWTVELALPEVGFFNAKGYVVDEHGRQVWPRGPNIGISVHPNEYRTGNVIYCAFTRLFGETKYSRGASSADPFIDRLDKEGYTVIPPSGKFRDLIAEFPHIFDRLGCMILHLLPVNPTPTTYARFGRFGSPYACEDLTLVDPALVEFDRRTTGIEQFQELTYAAHAKGGRVFLDIVINHAGWGSTLQENHPEWFLRKENGLFVSPGAWGTTWEDLVELDHRMPLSWEYLADVFVTWCRRGVDGFRCDAGYKVPLAAWRYITAKVRDEFPNAMFLLEGLGGAWEATEDLLTRGGMQWAYSELFQNHSPVQVSGYLDHGIRKSERVGTLVHYSETHDNERLAAQGRAWSLMRNRLCALTSHGGAFGYTCGVEWLATERVNVHSSRGLAWDNPDNLVTELAALGGLLRDHPCFRDGARARRLSGAESPVLALERISPDGADRLLVLVNLNHEKYNVLFLPQEIYEGLGAPDYDLLEGKAFPVWEFEDAAEFRLAAGASVALARGERIEGMRGEEYRRFRALHSRAIAALASFLEPEQIGPHSWTDLASLVSADPKRFLASLSTLRPDRAAVDLLAALREAADADAYPKLVEWTLLDQRRVTPVPPGHWLHAWDTVPFRAVLDCAGERQHLESVETDRGHCAFFPPRNPFRRPRAGDATLHLERYEIGKREARGAILFLNESPDFGATSALPLRPARPAAEAPIVLLTNGRGGMARMCVDLGAVKSKYDCVLAANLHPGVPVDRHVFVKRLRVWANADHFITPLDARNLQNFSPGPPARWEFAAIAGDGQVARLEIVADMLHESNTTIFSLKLLDTSKPDTTVRLTLRFDLEDRNFHGETHHNGGADHHFSAHTHALRAKSGFEFRPPGGRQARIFSERGAFHPSAEWSDSIAHPVEQTRGQRGAGDAYSPGWFDIPLVRGEAVPVVVTAEANDPSAETIASFQQARAALNEQAWGRAGLIDNFGRQLALATHAYVARREEFKTIIAGYPWFLDWGRDSLICARGLLAAGLFDEVKQLLIAFGRFEKDGTLPNTIHGEDASNRDTSDAPLWYGVVCEELAAMRGPAIYEVPVDGQRTVRDVLRGIAEGYRQGTPNRIHMDPESALIWSPSHFTWMDTNFPAGTPREGYPIEIQALWIRLLEQLDRLKITGDWGELAIRARASLLQYFWIEEKGWLADVMPAPCRASAAQATVDDALRSNCVIPLSFDLIPKKQARSCLLNVLRYLVVPGALRSLAPLSVKNPLPIHGPDWRLLNHPHEPYWGRYEGDEDTQRKPAYHNGTAWTWTFPGLCEAIARVWDFSPEAVAAGKHYLGSMEEILARGCAGHIPEVLDGDAPHAQRGCDAQSWGVTEALRVWKLLNRP
jgi:starch synthase (maltosyl-transferring)